MRVRADSRPSAPFLGAYRRDHADGRPRWLRAVHGFVGVDLGDLDGGKNPGPRLSGVERLV